MDATTPKENVDRQADRYPLLMERAENHNGQEHVIDVRRNDDASSSSSDDDVHVIHGMEPSEHEDRPSSSVHSHPERTSNVSNFGNPSILRRGDNYSQRRRRSPLDSIIWITVEFVITVGQIVASIVVLSLSRHENPQAPLFAWVVGYASGCFATLPILYWRYRNRNQNSEQLSGQSRHESSENMHPEPNSYAAISEIQVVDEENQHTTETASVSSPTAGTLNSRINGFVDHLKMALDCFFAVWFVVGNVWIFGGHTSPSDAPKLYRLCIVFLTFSCIGYAMPFILCATICCCLPCIISILGIREDFSQTRGASSESINALPTYKFKAKEISSDDDAGDSDGPGRSDGGLLAAGTENERIISGEDAVCCICLAKYMDNEELKELPCRHIFHVECIDKWLKINALCPLCKMEIGKDGANPREAEPDAQ